MNKNSRWICLVLCAAVILGCVLGVSAQEKENTIRIASKEDFLRFADHCRLDSYSRDLTVLLCADIDLTDTGFFCIPIFSGVFEGNGHTVSGLQLEGEGSNIGLFRYLTNTAVIRNLRLTGQVSPGGSGSIVGALAGSNAGTIENCSFEGKVSGIDSVGGLVGINQLTGIISRCTVNGSVNGNHFVGGIAGDNYGVIRESKNFSSINITIEQNDVDLEDVSLDSILHSESAATVTDIGGICGIGSGVIRDCANHGNIGYPKIGYNIGGIAGSWSGYLDNCSNYASVDGRKEVGGIVGQLEPAANILYEKDTLQALQEQMDTMSDIAAGTSAHIHSGSNALSFQSENIEKQVNEAQDALDILIPDEDDPNPPDPESVQAAQNALSSSLTEITSSLNSIISISESTLNTLNQDIQGITGQMNVISGTIGNATEHLGASISDVSDADTESDISAKIHECFNFGSVQGDRNIGGIAGAIALENDLDPESDVQLIGNSSLNYNIELRAVILGCENNGAVFGKKQNVGGIAGLTIMGLVKQCVNTASIDASAADYAGGIAGQSRGYIRLCSVKCTLSGEDYTGGIAGLGATVTDCHAMVAFDGSGERTGAILGNAEDSTLKNNYYLPIGADLGAVDGISYASKAEPLTADGFFSLDSLPDGFRNVTVTFIFGDSTSSISIPYGSILIPEAMYPIPEHARGKADWVGSIKPGEPVFFDAEFTLEYNQYVDTLDSSILGYNGLPILLAQGQFSQDAQLLVTAVEKPDALTAFTLQLPQSSQPIKLRCLLPEGISSDRVRLMVQTPGGWSESEFTVNGSYLVFNAPEAIQALLLEEIPADYTSYIVIGSALLGIIVLCTVLSLIRCRRKGRK